ncbi:hypothetical protein [Pseudomonas sp. NUPR-001]|uniref:hypothetical protein n=1 Tax=Pseudomonas sp. NUPR-001 TaxID=3416058 RepID=UPI003F98B541
MEIKNNPVGRLYAILREASGHGDGSPTHAVWQTVLGVPNGDTGALLKSIANLIHLQGEAKQALIDGIPGDQTIYLAPFAKIDNLFKKIDLTSRWAQHRQHLDEATLSALAFGDHVLEPQFGKTTLNADLVKTFVEQLDKLLLQCIDSDLPVALKRFFKDNLESLRQALLSYKIYGAQGIEDEIDRIWGTMSRHSADISDQVNGSSKGLMKSIFELIGNVNNSIQITETTLKLAGPVIAPWLPFLASISS